MVYESPVRGSWSTLKSRLRKHAQEPVLDPSLIPALLSCIGELIKEIR